MSRQVNQTKLQFQFFFQSCIKPRHSLVSSYSLSNSDSWYSKELSGNTSFQYQKLIELYPSIKKKDPSRVIVHPRDSTTNENLSGIEDHGNLLNFN